jgi:hypothetical protein
MDTLGISQAELGKFAQKSQAWASNLLRGRTSANREDLESIHAGLQCVLANPRHRLTAAQSSEVMGVLAALSRSFGDHPFIARPGGCIPDHAMNYVPRRTDTWADRLLEKPPFTVLVQGPPDVGKSTFLMLLERSAEKKHHMKVIAYDCKTVSQTPASEFLREKEGDLLQESDRLRHSRMSLEHTLIRTLARETGDRGWASAERLEDISPLLNEAIIGRAYPGLLLVLDAVSELPVEVSRALLGTVRTLHNDRGRYKTNLCIAVGMTWDSTSRGIHEFVRVSSTCSVIDPRIDIEWFTQDETRKLLGALDETLQSSTAVIFGQYSGQPFVTHAAAVRMLDASLKPEEVFLEACKGKGQFGYHVGQVEHLLANASEEALGILRTIAARGNAEANVLSQEVRFLADSHLVVRTGAEGNVVGLAFPSQFYRTLVESILRK